MFNQLNFSRRQAMAILKRTTLGLGLIATLLSVSTSAAAVITTPSDLDLTNVVKSINFGNTSNQTIGSTIFLAAATGTTVNGVTNNATDMLSAGQFGGAIPVYGATADDDALEQILATVIGDASSPKTFDIDVPLANGNYKLQFLFYEAFDLASLVLPLRLQDVTVEGTLIADDYALFAEQGGVLTTGSVLTYTVGLTDGNLDITMAAGTGNQNLSFSGLIISAINSEPVPEPSTYALGLIGLAGLGLLAWRRRKRTADR